MQDKTFYFSRRTQGDSWYFAIAGVYHIWKQIQQNRVMFYVIHYNSIDTILDTCSLSLSVYIYIYIYTQLYIYIYILCDIHYIWCIQYTIHDMKYIYIYVWYTYIVWIVTSGIPFLVHRPASRFQIGRLTRMALWSWTSCGQASRWFNGGQP